MRKHEKNLFFFCSKAEKKSLLPHPTSVDFFYIETGTPEIQNTQQLRKKYAIWGRQEHQKPFPAAALSSFIEGGAAMHSFLQSMPCVPEAFCTINFTLFYLRAIAMTGYSSGSSLHDIIPVLPPPSQTRPIVNRADKKHRVFSSCGNHGAARWCAQP